MATVKSIFSWIWGIFWLVAASRESAANFISNWPRSHEARLRKSIIIKPAVLCVTAATAFRTAHEIAEHIAHVGLDFFRVFAGFEPFDGHIEFLRHGTGRHEVFHFFHHVRHVPRIVFVQVLHGAFHFHHGAPDARVVEIGQGRFATGHFTFCRRFLQSPAHGEPAARNLERKGGTSPPQSDGSEWNRGPHVPKRNVRSPPTLRDLTTDRRTLNRTQVRKSRRRAGGKGKPGETQSQSRRQRQGTVLFLSYPEEQKLRLK